MRSVARHLDVTESATPQVRGPAPSRGRERVHGPRVAQRRGAQGNIAETRGTARSKITVVTLCLRTIGFAVDSYLDTTY